MFEHLLLGLKLGITNTLGNIFVVITLCYCSVRIIHQTNTAPFEQHESKLLRLPTELLSEVMVPYLRHVAKLPTLHTDKHSHTQLYVIALNYNEECGQLDIALSCS